MTSQKTSLALNHFIPALHVSPAAFAVVGMGAVVGSSTAAAMAATVMIFEMTLDYTVIIPMTLTVAISYAVRRRLVKDSIYTRKLTLRGDSVPETMRADVPFSRCAADIMHPWSLGVPAAWENAQGDDAPESYITVPGDATLLDVIAKMRANEASVALVMPAALVGPEEGQFNVAQVEGMITFKEILERLAGDMELFSD